MLNHSWCDRSGRGRGGAARGAIPVQDGRCGFPFQLGK